MIGTQLAYVVAIGNLKCYNGWNACDYYEVEPFAYNDRSVENQVSSFMWSDIHMPAQHSIYL